MAIVLQLRLSGRRVGSRVEWSRSQHRAARPLLEALRDRARRARGSRAMTRIVSSPPIVPAISGSAARSRSTARICARPGSVLQHHQVLHHLAAAQVLAAARRSAGFGGGAPGPSPLGR